MGKGEIARYEQFRLFLHYRILDLPNPKAFESYPLPNDKFLDVNKLKAFADDRLNIAKMTISLFDRVEKEKMLVTSIFSFSHIVFKSLLL